MANISSPGIGSGVDVQSIVSQLVALERSPIKQLQTQASTLQTKLSLYGTIKSQMSSLADAASRLASSTTWKAATATSTNTAAVGVSASTGALSGNYSVQVQQLARAQSVASTAFAEGASVGTGTLTIEIGQWSGNSFTAGEAEVIQIEIGPGDDTLSAIAARINAAGSDVRASVLRDSNGERLLVQSAKTGEASGFRITAADDDGNHTDAAGLSALAYDAGQGGGMSLAQSGLNAQAVINGVAVSSATNQLTDVLPGLTLQLTQVTSQPVDVSVDVDKDDITKNIQALVDAYNTINTTLANALKYDQASGKGGTLQGDSTAVGLQNALRGMMRSITGSEPFSRLLDVGIELQSGGALKIDSAKLNAALDNLEGIKSLFTVDTGDASTQGFALKLKAFAKGLLDTEGSIITRSNALQDAITRNTKEQERQEDRVSRVEKRLLAQYTALDTKMASFNTLSAFVMQQLSLWNNGS